jgi:dihydroflavonol-4-reductase
MSRTLLVTGAGGFIGGHVCRLAQQHGWRVRGLDLAFPHPIAGEAITGSILDPAALRAALAGADAVVHGAAITSLWARDPADFMRVNAEGSRAVARAAREAGARMAHISSYTVLVSGPRGGAMRTVDEGSELPPDRLLGPYPAAKRQAELFVLDEVSQGLFATILLPSAPVGPGDWSCTPPTRLLMDLAAGRLPAILDAPMNLVDVESVAQACLAALELGRPGRRYLLSGEDAPLSHIARIVASLSGVRAPSARVPYGLALATAEVEALWAKLTGRPPRAPLTGVRLAGRNIGFSNARARAELGFAPPPLAETLAHAVAAFRGLQPTG